MVRWQGDWSPEEQFIMARAEYWSARGADQVAEQIPVAETPPAAMK
jgi:hypothetical protein